MVQGKSGVESGDLVFFRKSESSLDGKWVVGMIDEVERGRDSVIRMVTVKYFNGTNPVPEYTLRTVRKLVKLWDVQDIHLADDIAEMERKFGPLPIQVSSQVHCSDDKKERCSAHSNLTINYRGSKFRVLPCDPLVTKDILQFYCSDSQAEELDYNDFDKLLLSVNVNIGDRM